MIKLSDSDKSSSAARPSFGHSVNNSSIIAYKTSPIYILFSLKNKTEHH